MSAHFRPSGKRDGLAMIMVLGLGLVVLVVGMAMITTSGGLLQGTVDAKQRIRARYASESMIAIQIARAVEKASDYFGQGLSSEEIDWMDLKLPGGERAKADIVNQAREGDPLKQERIQTGRLKGLMGLRIPIQVVATSKVGARSKKEVDADVRLYQVPIFQFGVFYEGNLEITPGPNMHVFGPVHTNSNAYFRGATNSVLSFQGPVTVSGTLNHWIRSGGAVRYFLTSDTTAYMTPALTTSMSALNSTTKPPAIGGVYNIDDQREKLILPIGGSRPSSLIEPCDSLDPASLQKQKFACMIKCDAAGICPPSRWVNGYDPLGGRTYITGPKVFFDRREDRWVKFWDIDVGLMTTLSHDSIFYFADTVTMFKDHGTTKTRLLNAFRIVNAKNLPRNMTIASANPVYILGDFNLAKTGGACAPRDYGATVPDSLKYCNAQIASDAVTLLSSNWPNMAFNKVWMNGSLEQDTTAANWTRWPSKVVWNNRYSRYDTTWSTGTEPTSGSTGSYNGTTRVNAAILTGNKPSRPATFADGTEATFESLYEGGWHNTIRFLENLDGGTTIFKGSFVCMWAASTKGLDLDSTGTPTIKSGHYSPPIRVWGFDPRFRSLNNMPPGTPFLATAVFTNWIEKQ